MGEVCRGEPHLYPLPLRLGQPCPNLQALSFVFLLVEMGGQVLPHGSWWELLVMAAPALSVYQVACALLDSGPHWAKARESL